MIAATEAIEPEEMDGIDADAEVLTCSADAAYFTDTYGVIDDTQGVDEHATGGLTRFRLWPAQIKVMWALMSERLVLILKARQLGISWAVCAFILWHCLFEPNRTVLVLSKGQKEANEMLRRVKVLYQRLPAWMRARLPVPADRDNASEFDWRNGSRVMSLPATRNAGISFTASLVVLDEAAHMKYGSELYLNIKPTIDAGGQMVILSTANGLGGLFHGLWDKAAKGLNAFKTVFLPWWARPGRDRGWFARMKAESTDPKLIPQNYPANPVEAFLASGQTRFEPEWIAAQAKHLRDPIPRGELPPSLRDIPGLKVWERPQRGEEYVLGADVAEGLETGDFDGCPVLNRKTWEVVAVLHGRWETDHYAKYLIQLADAYNDALIGVERNNHGHAVLVAMRLHHYDDGTPFPFASRVALGHDGRPGWYTTEKTKQPGIDLIAAALRDELITIHDLAVLSELQVYRRLKGGKTGAPEEYHDDLVMGLYVALCVMREESLRPKAAAPLAVSERSGHTGQLKTQIHGWRQ